MSFWSFVLYFIIGLIGMVFWLDFAPNKFIAAFIIALLGAILGVRGDQ